MSIRESSPEGRLESSDTETSASRREFLNKCGKFAAYTTPAMVLLLDYQLANAKAHSGRVNRWPHHREK